MFNVRLAGGHLYGKQLFTWLSLWCLRWRLFMLSFFPLDVLDEIWDVIESVSEGFLTYSYFYQCSLSYRRALLQYYHSGQGRYTPISAPCHKEELLCSTTTHDKVDILLSVVLVV